MNNLTDLNDSLNEEDQLNETRYTHNDSDVIILDDENDSSQNKIEVGTRVFALFDSIRHIWKPAKIESIIIPNEKFQVKFVESNKKNNSAYPIDDYDQEVNEIEKNSKQENTETNELDATCIAFINASVKYLPIRSRVVSFYNISILDSSKSNYLLKSEYMSSATIAELPNQKNKERYLLFFDNGSVAYVKQTHTYPILESIILPIERLNFDHVYFIRSYFENYPSRSLVYLKKNDQIMIYLNTNWFECKVIEVDNVLVRFELDKRIFTISSRSNFKHNDIWFYRGSTRLLPIYELLSNRLKEAKLDDTIELNQYENYANDKLNKPLTDDNYLLTRFSSTLIPMYLPNQDPSEQGELVESNLEHIMRTRLVNYIPHECHYDCVSRWESKLKKTDNLLLIPLYNGWLRLICSRSKTRHISQIIKIIVYVTPCGKHLRSIDECDFYLNLTNSVLSSDMFSFDFNVKPNREFKPKVKYFRLCDVTNGKEKIPVSCVNNVDNKKPPQFDYTTDLKSFGIDLNENNDNLDCCECKDNCSDKSNCSCWQKTLNFASLESDAIKNVGYKGRRLEQRVNTGIFECNSKCKCNHRCTNRLVQNGTKVRLELFKTNNKGWGLRCLDDLPKGTFVTVYSGHIMTEEESNMRAVEFGDEYFAELDYIGRLMKLKNENLAILTPSNSSENDSDNSNLKRKLNEIENHDNDLIILNSDSESNLSFEPKKLKREEILKLIFSMKYFDVHKVYIIDAKNCGNISRFLNHSCAPNVFIQNVFVETTDLRYPQTAIFTLNAIKAGTELTWDYNYQVGSIRGRQLYCYCKSAKCRGRLI